MEETLVFVAVIVAAAACSVAVRLAWARSRGEDAREAGRRALRDAIPVVGAGLAGALFFLATMFLAFFWFVGTFHNPSAARASVPWMIALISLGIAVGLLSPIVAVVLVIRRRRRA